VHLKVSKLLLILTLSFAATFNNASAQVPGDSIYQPRQFFPLDTIPLPSFTEAPFRFDYSTYNNKGHRDIVDSIFNDSIIKLTPLLESVMDIRLHDPMEVYRPAKSQIHELNNPARIWIFVISCIIVLMIIVFRLLNKRRFSEYIFSVFNPRLNSKIIRDQGISLVSLFIQLTFIHIFIAALTLWVFMLHFKTGLRETDSGLYTYLLIVVALIFIYLLKYMLQFIISDMFLIDEVALFHINSVITVNTATSLMLFPVLLVYIYYPSAQFKEYIILIISALIFISIGARIVRIFFQSLETFRYPIIYLFIYICGFEVAPWLFIIKYFVKD
jgi:hypothetical protein